MSGIFNSVGSKSGIISGSGSLVHLGTYHANAGDSRTETTGTLFQDVWRGGIYEYQTIEINQVSFSGSPAQLTFRFYNNSGTIISADYTSSINARYNKRSDGSTGDYFDGENNASSGKIGQDIGYAGGEGYNASLKLSIGEWTHPLGWHWPQVAGVLNYGEQDDKAVIGTVSVRNDNPVNPVWGFQIFSPENFVNGSISCYGMLKHGDANYTY